MTASEPNIDKVASEILQLLPTTESNAGAQYYRQQAHHGIRAILGALHRTGRAIHFRGIGELMLNATALEYLERQLQTCAPGSEELRAFTLFLDKFRKMVDEGNEKVLSLDTDKLKKTFGGIAGRLFSYTDNFQQSAQTNRRARR